MDLIVLLEEVGRRVLPTPYLSTVVLCGLPIRDFGTEEQKREFLPKIARGEMIMALALTEPSARYDASGVKVSAIPQDEDFVINGTKLFVHDAHIANQLLVATRTSEGATPEEGISLFLVDAKSPGISYTLLKTIASDKQCEIVFDNVRVSKRDTLGKVDRGWEIIEKTLEQAAVAECALMIGGAQAALDISNSYAKERIQFDKPIGSFQVVQFKLVDMMTALEVAKYLTYEAAWKINEGLPFTLEASMAKAKANEAYQRICIEGIQIHGAFGFHGEKADIIGGLYYRRAKAAEIAFGDADFHREKVAQGIGL
jgi:alkylation response protein AidB-like acyl-CoA dehydrogenase